MGRLKESLPQEETSNRCAKSSIGFKLRGLSIYGMRLAADRLGGLTRTG